MYSSGGQMGFSFDIGAAWDSVRRFFGSSGNNSNPIPTGQVLTPGYHPGVMPFPVQQLTAAGANVTDIDNLATISDWAASVVEAGRVPTRERIPMLHAGELASMPQGAEWSDLPAPDAVRAADQATRGRFQEWIDALLVVHQYTALPANVSPLAQLSSGTGLLKWGAIAFSAYVLVPALLGRNPPRGARRRRRRR